MQLKDICYIMDIMETGSLSKSAERLFVTQPTLTQSVQRMEEELHVQLFRRTRFGMEPTVDGILFSEYARDIIAQCDRLKKRMLENSAAKSTYLRMGVAKLYSKFIYPLYITPFCNQNPDISVELIEERAPSLEMKLLNDELDLCILATPIESNLLTGVPLFCEELLVALPNNHRLNKDYSPLLSDGTYPEIDISLLKDEVFVIPKEGYRLNRLFLNMCSMLGFWPKHIVEIESVDTILDFVRKNEGVGIVSDLFAKNDIWNRQVQCYRIKNASSKRLFMILFPSGKKLSRTAQEYLNCMAKQLNLP